MPSFKDIFKVVEPQSAEATPPATNAAEARQEIEADIQKNPIMIYMKGTPEMPQCGFSASVIAVFNELGKPYKTQDVLSNPLLRQEIKSFSQWPTIPQIYISGKFLGGCDIILEMHQAGELQPLVEKAAS